MSTGNIENTFLNSILRNLTSSNNSARFTTIPVQTTSTTQNTNSPIPILCPDLNDVLYLYNKTVMEYYYTIQRIMDTMSTSRINAQELRNILYYMNQSFHQYNSTIDRSIQMKIGRAHV